MPDSGDLDRLQQGVRLDEGTTRPARVALKRAERDQALVEVEIHEGKKPQVKRIFEAVGHPVEALTRGSFAGIGVEGLARGKWRYLRAAKVEGVRRQTGLTYSKQ